MTIIKKSIGIILAAVMLLGVLVVAPLTTSAATAFKHDVFEITDPVKNGVYDVNEDIVFAVNIKKDCEELLYPRLYLTIEKDGEKVEEFVISISRGLDRQDYSGRWYVFGRTIGTRQTEIFSPKKTGKYTVVITLTSYSHTEEEFKAGKVGSYSFSVVKKKANPITVKTATKTMKISALKKAKKTVKPLTIKNAKGTVKVVKVKKGIDSKIYKKITVDKKTGKITFKKGSYKKGTYKVKLKVTAAGNNSYKAKTVTKTVKIKIK